MDGHISAHVVVDDESMSGRGHTTVLELSWHREDPLAVRLKLEAEPDHPALPRGEWAVLRAFLRYGLEEPTGDGDVRIHPDGEGEVVLELVGGPRPYSVHVSGAVVLDFLDATEAIVPSGDAAEDEIIEALISRLLET